MKKIMCVILVFFSSLSLLGCQKDKAEKEPVEVEERKEMEVIPELVKEIDVYIPDSEKGFQVEQMEVDALRAEEVIRCLTEKKVLLSGIKVNRCETVGLGKEKVIDLDLSVEFSGYLEGLDTTKEREVVGSLTNTFLKAYRCVGLQITVDGKELKTKSAEYPGYLSVFE